MADFSRLAAISLSIESIIFLVCFVWAKALEEASVMIISIFRFRATILQPMLPDVYFPFGIGIPVSILYGHILFGDIVILYASPP